jgi:hypothetical protein
MFCNLQCLIALVFIIGNIYFMMGMDKFKLTQEFKKLLNEKQLAIYQSIVEERRDLSIKGYCYGVVLAFLLIGIDRFFLKNRLSKTPMVCLVVSLAFSVQYFYYILSPKQPLMVTHLETEEQRHKWQEVYKAYQNRYHSGISIGIIGVGLLAYGSKC